MINERFVPSFLLLAKGTLFGEFDTFFTVLKEEATKKGLDDDILNQLADVIIHTDLGW